MLQKMGCAVIEADLIAHGFLKRPNPVAQQIVAEFGAGILDSGGEIDRRELGRIVFADAQKLARLNALTHPQVLRKIAADLAELERAGAIEIAVVVAALHVEAGYSKTFDRLAVAWCTREQQMTRLMGRGCTQAEAEQRINSQMPLEEKRRLADDVIDCSQSIEFTERQTREVFSRWKQLAQKKSPN